MERDAMVEEERPVSPKPVEQMERDPPDERSPLLLNWFGWLFIRYILYR